MDEERDGADSAASMPWGPFPGHDGPDGVGAARRTSERRHPASRWGRSASRSGRPVHATTRASHTPARRARTRRHCRAALTGIVLAAVLLTALQLYAAQGIADARQAALDRAHLQVSAPR